MTYPFLTLDDFDLEHRKVLVRLDINSPIDPASGDLMDETRLRSHLETLRALRDSAVVIIAHQSRPGKKDFVSLQRHARRLRRHLERLVHFQDSLFNREALQRIDNLSSGEVLENVRFNAEEVSLKGDMETLANARYVRILAPHFDLFINDAFAAAHRLQPSTVGFIPHLPSAAGWLMERELTVLHKVLGSAERPAIAVLGGAKADDAIMIMDHMLSKGIVDRILTAGVVANIMLIARGVDLGSPSTEFIRKHVPDADGCIERARKLLATYGDAIGVPTDVALNRDGERHGVTVDTLPAEYPIHDIGIDTVVRFVKEIEEAGTVIVNGPAGVFELPEFAFGTEELFHAISRTDAFTVAGGGETSAVLTRMGLRGEVDHLSTGGGACIALLSGRELPVEQALIQAREWYLDGMYDNM
ncbi:MAG TPA: phosphoglycerate kinase [Thermoplasmata archaeon]|nr:phosphoglycerate kinase [Thermoplasmata archaeon]